MSLREIANYANVSKATVSRVLNGTSKVSPKSTKKVQDAIRSLGFTDLLKNIEKSTRIAVIITGRDVFIEYSPARWRMLYGIQETACENNMDIVLIQIPDSSDLPKNFDKASYCGAILMGANDQNTHENIISKITDLPSVWINSQGSNDKDNALARNQLVGQMAAHYLTSRGHKNLAFFKVLNKHLALEMDGDFFSFTAMKSNCKVTTITGQDDFPEDDSLSAWMNLQNTVKNAMSELVRQKPMPTGLFIPIGQVVVMCYRELEKMGIKPGKDIEIIACGCENGMISALSPMPANISINAETIGRKAVEQLIWSIENPNESSPINITVMPTISTPK